MEGSRTAVPDVAIDRRGGRGDVHCCAFAALPPSAFCQLVLFPLPLTRYTESLNYLKVVNVLGHINKFYIIITLCFAGPNVGLRSKWLLYTFMAPPNVKVSCDVVDY